MIAINGKEYPLLSQFVEGKNKWIGGVLEDYGDDIDKYSGRCPIKTEITDIVLRPNGDGAFFEVHGKDFICGFSTALGGVTTGEDGWITFSGYGGHKWRIQGKEGK